MKHVKLLLVFILLMVLATGCQNKVEAPKGGNTNNEVFWTDEMYEKQIYAVKFVAVKLENEEDGRTYYKVYERGNRAQIPSGVKWAIELPIELQPWEFAYVTANFTEIIGGVGGGGLEIDEITECKKISLEEAVGLLASSRETDFYKCETEFFDVFGIFTKHSKVNDLEMLGDLRNRYEDREKKENSYYGDVTVYLQSEVIGRYNRLDFVGDYLVLYHHEGDENDLTLPENVSIEAIEELLATEKQYNDYMFVLHKREENIDTSYRKFLLGDRTLVDESQAKIPDFHDSSARHYYVYSDLDGDGGNELVIRSYGAPDDYFGVFHYEEDRITCWYSDFDEDAFYYLLQDGTVVREYNNYPDEESYTIFRFGSDGSMEDVSESLDAEQLIRKKELHVDDWFSW